MSLAPDAPPRSISGCCINSTAITVLWDVVPEEQRNGIIVLYTIQYKPKGRLSRWQELSVTGTLLTARIGNLEHYTMYQCRIAASNRGGRGPYSNIIDIRTDAGGTCCFGTFIKCYEWCCSLVIYVLSI